MKRKLSLRVKMTLWFTLSVLAVTALFFGALYLTTRAKLDAMLRDDLRLAMEQLSSQVEHKSGGLVFEDETPVKAGIMYYIMEGNGSELVSYGEDIALFDSEPVREGEFTRAERGEDEWLLLDSPLISVGEESVRIRVIASCGQIRQTLLAFKAIFVFGVPVMTALAALIGFEIANRSLRPVHRIIACANEIAQGDLSRRVPEEPAADELGELTRTLNRMLASLEESFRRERRFTSDASHELRTPVAVILAYAESLAASPALPQEEREKAETILDECRRMQRMIAQMLTLTRAQEGRCPVTMERVCLNDILEGVTAALDDAAGARKIALHVEPGERVEITADQSLMTQLTLNLAENAVKYGREGGNVWLSASGGKDRATLTVRDDGIGISEENLPHIFERFFRADAARDRTGTGLGLSIVQWIVSLHGGQIDVKSRLGEGTEFTVTLPQKQ